MTYAWRPRALVVSPPLLLPSRLAPENPMTEMSSCSRRVLYRVFIALAAAILCCSTSIVFSQARPKAQTFGLDRHAELGVSGTAVDALKALRNTTGLSIIADSG